ncbi:MAG: SRPBCC family protein [Chitinophagaceae bacterium]|nr:SRPBCC family protein [Chitinophagaceae bacterium]
MLKKILLIIIALLGIYLILCLAGPKKTNVSASYSYSCSPEMLYDQIGDFKNWPNWSKWMKEDPGMKLTWGPTTSGKGATYSWESEKSGSGSMLFNEVVPNKMIKSELTFKDWDATSDVVMEIKQNGNKTDIIWTMQDRKDFPFIIRGLMFIMNMNGSIKKDFDKGLKNLDEYIQSGKAGVTMNGYLIKSSKFEAKNYLGKRSMVAFKDISKYFETHLPKIGELAKQDIIGPPSGLFWDWNMQTQMTDMAAAMPVSNSQISNPDYQIISIPSMNEYTIDYYGAYDKTQMAYAALDSLIKQKGIDHPEQVVEEYLTDPGMEKDTSKWLTKIHYLVK